MDWIHGAKEGWRGEKTTRQKKSRGRGDGERWRRAYFYAQGNQICQLLGDTKLGWGTIGELFFDFLPKKQECGREIEYFWSLGDALGEGTSVLQTVPWMSCIVHTLTRSPDTPLPLLGWADVSEA